MDIKRMTRKTLIYYALPLVVVAAVIGTCAQSLFWTIYGLIKNGFSPALLAVQVLSVVGAVLLVFYFIKRLVPFCKVFYYIKKVQDFHYAVNMSNRCLMLDGAPGTGKTFSSIYLACYQSLLLWEELVTQYL